MSSLTVDLLLLLCVSMSVLQVQLPQGRGRTGSSDGGRSDDAQGSLQELTGE